LFDRGIEHVRPDRAARRRHGAELVPNETAGTSLLYDHDRLLQDVGDSLANWPDVTSADVPAGPASFSQLSQSSMLVFAWRCSPNAITKVRLAVYSAAFMTG
jgi:hypothetical protein